MENKTQLYDVYEVTGNGTTEPSENDARRAQGLTKKEASKLANGYGRFDNGDPCAYYKPAA